MPGTSIKLEQGNWTAMGKSSSRVGWPNLQRCEILHRFAAA